MLRDGGFCFYADEDAIAPLWKGQRFPLEACVSGLAMTAREPIVIPTSMRTRASPMTPTGRRS